MVSDYLQPWERQPEEPARWWGRFLAYRMLGPQRTMVQVYSNERVSAGKPASKLIPGTWNAKAQEWTWTERAIAWDVAEAERKDAARLALEKDLADQSRERATKSHEMRMRAADAWLGVVLASLGRIQEQIRADQTAKDKAQKEGTEHVPLWVPPPMAVLNAMFATALRELRAEHDQEPTQRFEVRAEDVRRLARLLDIDPDELQRTADSIAAGRWNELEGAAP